MLFAIFAFLALVIVLAPLIYIARSAPLAQRVLRWIQRTNLGLYFDIIDHASRRRRNVGPILRKVTRQARRRIGRQMGYAMVRVG